LIHGLLKTGDDGCRERRDRRPERNLQLDDEAAEMTRHTTSENRKKLAGGALHKL